MPPAKENFNLLRGRNGGDDTTPPVCAALWVCREAQRGKQPVHPYLHPQEPVSLGVRCISMELQGVHLVPICITQGEVLALDVDVAVVNSVPLFLITCSPFLILVPPPVIPLY